MFSPHTISASMLRILRLAPFVIGLSLMLACGSALRAQDVPEARRATTVVLRDSMDHSGFTELLARYVDETGNVDYAGLTAHADSALAPYLRRLARTDPATLSRDARLAFWINAYNALTLKLIVDHYPVDNIWGITPGPPEPKDDSPFRLELAEVADTVRTLDEIEHEIIRRRFDEPRIHFALVCAANSCPPLRREAYTGPRLDAQLDEQARTFLHDNAKNRIPAKGDTIALSRILKWYGQDFGPATDALQRFAAPYFENEVKKNLTEAAYEVTFLPYDWTLNDQAHAEGAASRDEALRSECSWGESLR
jgi:hypothetical protein